MVHSRSIILGFVVEYIPENYVSFSMSWIGLKFLYNMKCKSVQRFWHSAPDHIVVLERFAI